MRKQVQAVVIGGGIVGASVLYHLTKLGWRDVILLERRVLTAGSTWHAAAGFFALNGDPNMANLQAYGIRLFEEIQEESGQDVGVHMSGGVNVAATPQRWEFLQAEAAKHKVMGLESRLVGPAEVADLSPLIDVSDVYGGLYDPNEGHCDPYGVTNAYVTAAKARGAEVIQHNWVSDLSHRDDGSWDVITEQGTIHTQHVVNAAGLWAREVGYMAGVNHPLLPYEHHYIVTEPIPEIEALDDEMALVVDLDGEMYMRQEGNGVLLGVYERPATPWAVEGTSWDYGETDLLEPQMQRLEDALGRGFERFPVLGDTGITRVVNGPFTFTPDGNPLVGPVPGVANYWSACGVMAGFSQGGGIGLTLAQWMIEGQPERDVFFAMDLSRLGEFATPNYTRAKATQFYERRFAIAYPNEFWPAGRPLKTSPVHDRLAEAGAHFGESYGLEFPLFFATEGFEETYAFQRSNAHDFTGAEVRATRESAGLLDATSFARYEVAGPGAEAFLNRILASRLPSVGRIRLAPMLSRVGRLMGDLTCMRFADDRFWLMGSGYLQGFHTRWFDEHLPDDGVTITNMSDSWSGFTISGPASREIVGDAFAMDSSAEAMKFLTVQEIDAGLAPAVLARISLSGELGFEVYTPSPYVAHIHTALMAAGADRGLAQIGIRALDSMRLEKSAGVWGAEFTPDYTATMSGLSTFVDYDKPDFIGRDAALIDRESPPERRLVTMVVDALDADVSGFEPVWGGEDLIGFVTSGGYGHSVHESIAMAYVDSHALEGQADVSVEILSSKRPARILDRCLVDPTGERMRS